MQSLLNIIFLGSLKLMLTYTDLFEAIAEYLSSDNFFASANCFRVLAGYSAG